MYYKILQSKPIMTRLTKLPIKAICLLFTFFVLSFQMMATTSNSNPWTTADESRFVTKGMERTIVPKKYKTFRLDLPALQTLLETAPLRFSADAENSQVVLMLPMPNGTVEKFQIFDAPIMEAELAAEYPMIHSYAGVGIDDPTASLRFDVTQFGFHGLVLSARHSSVYIDPYSKADIEHYIAYYKSDFEKANNNFSCHVQGESDVDDVEDLENVNSLLQGDCQLRTYRIALTCSGEYAAFHGGNVADVLAAMNTTMTRVNGVYERDMNVNMVIVNDNDQLIFLDANTDPYNNTSATQVINESHVQCTNIIGTNNFDVGHCFTTGAGGLAGLGVICQSNNKGRGVTGTNSPVGDPYDIDYVAHELGHQFGANHTFNNSCGNNRNGGTAMEPGSGSTIMAYAGICGPNVQFSSDDYFHAISLFEMTNHILNGTGSNCPTITNTGNNTPTLAASNNYVLPISTPFKLTATGSDPDGDVLTYCWEQMNNDIGNMPPASTNTVGPMFRTYDPTEDDFRYFPKINDIVNGIDDDWEELPSVSRSMDFRVTVRDNHQGSGCTEEEDVNLTFDVTAGPFLVQAPNTNVTWVAGTNETVTWDVAKTDVAPVNCANVDILLSTDGGFTYPTTIASSVPNTGTYNIIVPNLGSTTCRVMVVCSDNIFFDISNTNFEIDATSFPTFIMGANPQVQDVCGSVGSVEYTMNLNGLAGFNETVTLTTSGVPNGAMVNFSQNNFVPTGTSNLTISNLGNVANGTYTIMVEASSTSIEQEHEVTLIVNNSVPSAVTQMNPLNGATAQSSVGSFTWSANSDATNYMVEIATTPSFGNSIIETATVSNNTYTAQNLAPLTVYYWRVSPSNNCGVTNANSFFAFQTDGSACNTYSSADTPIIIAEASASTINSSIVINNNFTITDVNIGFDVSHTWIGDLGAILTSPNNTSIELFSQPGVPASQYGCGSDNVLLTFDDDASATATQLENTCNNGSTYAAEGTFQPLGNLSDFNGASGNGDWVLSMSDAVGEDGGVLNSWNLEVCYAQATGAMPSLVNNVLNAQQGSPEPILNNNLQATSATASAADITFVILSLPQNGTLLINGVAATIGSTFTQMDINNNVLIYNHLNVSTTQDQFIFDVVTNDGAWISNEIFNIIIGSTSFGASASVQQEVSCNGGNDGIITVNAFGANPPFQYSLNGVGAQASEIFNNLTAGTYTINVIDNMGNQVATNTVTITEPMPITVSSLVDGTTIIVNANGGTGTLLYSLDGLPTQSSNIFTNVLVGTHIVTVTDENGCTISENNINVTSVPLAVSAIVEAEVTCFNGADGIIMANATGGAAPLQYSIDGTNFQMSNTFGNLSAGNYTITVQDNDGQSITTNTITITNPAEIVVNADIDGTMVTLIANGGIGNLMYNINGSNFQNSNIFQGLPNGQFTFVVMDENGCTTETIETINVIQSANIATTTVTCVGDQDGAISVSEISGGTPPYLYSLDNVNFVSSTEFAGLAIGAYNVYVMDAAGYIFDSGTIQVGNAPELFITVQAMDNSIIANGNGGTGTLIYSINGVDFQTSNEFTDLPNGNYTVTVQDENGCTKESIELSINFTNTNELDFDINFDLFPNPTQGEMTLILNQVTDKDLTLRIYDVAGKLAQEIRLEKSGIQLQENINVSNLPAGSYEIMLTDGSMFGRKRFVKM